MKWLVLLSTIVLVAQATNAEKKKLESGVVYADEDDGDTNGKHRVCFDEIASK